MALALSLASQLPQDSMSLTNCVFNTNHWGSWLASDEARPDQTKQKTAACGSSYRGTQIPL
ncbi:MAG: hypothetical protein RR845_18120, partial [Pseudomonas sp.]